MEDINAFFEEAKKQGIITADDREATQKMLHGAEKLWEEAIGEGGVLDRFVNDGDIDPKRIGEATVGETDHRKTERHRPVIDLVQQGGGMLGIALLGYTYIMERAGIRFYSYGGTSAGAINAAFLAAIPNSIYGDKSIFADRQTTKSEVITHIIANSDFSVFMDRENKTIEFFQRKVFKNYKTWWVWLLLGGISLALMALLYGVFGSVFSMENGLQDWEIRVYDFIVGTLGVFAFLLFTFFMIIKLLGPNYGVNPGKTYFDWVDTFMDLCDLRDTRALHDKLKQSLEVPDDYEGTPAEARLVLMTSDLTQNKVAKLPEEAGDYWRNPLNVKPAFFLRATMSLPFIFHVLRPSPSHYGTAAPTNGIVQKVNFVDGGMLSNFPIREFHRPPGIRPLFPTFGVLLTDTDQESADSGGVSSLLRYIGSYIKTFRSFYDNDFLLNHGETKHLIELVNTKGYNWLNFWMLKDEKKGLFLQGAKAAIKQLKEFDWPVYLEARTKEVEGYNLCGDGED